MARQKEGDLNKAILDYVQLFENQGIAYAVRNNSIHANIVRKDGSMGFIRNGKRGSPDLTFCVAGRYVGCESKLKNGRQSEDQKEAQRRIESAGGLYWLIRSIDEFITHFQELIGHAETEAL